MPYYTLRLCSGRGGYEAVPRPKLALDLAEARQRLEAMGIPVTDARVMLIARMASEVTLSRDGRVLIKSDDAGAASRVFDELRSILSLPEVVDEPPRPSGSAGPSL